MITFDTALAKLEFDKIRQRIARYAMSDMGREQILSLHISTSAAEIRSELSRITEVKRLLEEEAEFPLAGIHPVRVAIQKAAVEGTVLRPRELMQIASTLRAARVLRSFLARKKETYPLLWQIAEPLHVNKILEYNIEQAVDESGSMRASASRELQTIRRSIADRYDQLRKRLEGILRNVADLGFSQDEIITTREGRMVIPVKVEHKNRVPGFIHSASSSGATVFIEPTETLELNNEIRSLQFQEQREIERILKSLTVQVGAERDPLLVNMDELASLDVLHAKAKYSIEILGVAPFVSDEGPIRLFQARHPILMMTHGYGQTVPLDLELGGAYRTLVISGPNAGGKSVAMKCVGILQLMVQAGLHIPASDQSIVRTFGTCFVDIGDEQSIENDLSTFSSRLANLKQIAELADNRSLVLIDEIGSGTDPGEGGALASAVLEWLTRRGAYTIATTHQGSLKVFAHETDGVENGAMEFDQATLTPTYRFKAGIPGSSYALEMAQRIGFAQQLMTRAREALGQQQTKLESLIADLESSSQRYRKDLEAVLAEKTRLDDLVRKYEAKTSALAAELKESKRKALEEAEAIVEKANATIELSIKEIRERGADKQVVKAAREEVARLKEHIAVQQEEVGPPELEAPPDDLAAGSIVTLASGTDAGEIESIAGDGRTAVVIFGNLKMRVSTTDLRPGRKRNTAARSSFSMPTEKPVEVKQDLDVRGMTGDEALPLVDKFIDDAVLAGLHRIDIIHGKGTGALRKKVTDFLAAHPRVKSYRLGEWNEGGTGATVVELTEN